MIISDLSYLEVISSVPNIVGGILRSRTNQITAKAKVKNDTRGSSNTVTTDQSVSIVASNDDL